MDQVFGMRQVREKYQAKGLVEEDNGIRCERCKGERKAIHGMDGQCQESIDERGMSVEQGRIIMHNIRDLNEVMNA